MTEIMDLTGVLSLAEARASTDEFCVWDATAIMPGMSKNMVMYSESTLQAAFDAKLFAGVPVYDYSEEDHVWGGGGVNNLVGFFNATKCDKGQIIGELSLMRESETAKKIAAFKGKETVAAKATPKLSIKGRGKMEFKEAEGRVYYECTEVREIVSVDVVINAAAGGKFNKLLRESIIPTEETEMPEPVVEKTISEAEAVELRKTVSTLADTLATMAETTKRSVFDARVATLLAEAKTLPAHNKENVRIRSTVLYESKKGEVADADIQVVIDAERNSLAEAAQVVAESQRRAFTPISIGLESSDKLAIGFERFFLGDDPEIVNNKLSESDQGHIWKGIPAIRSIKEAVQHLTGMSVFDMTHLGHRFVNTLHMQDMRPDGTLSESHEVADLPNLFANLLTKRMLREYNRPGNNAWRQLVQTTTVTDLKQQNRLRWGGFGNIPAVAERGTYLDLGKVTETNITWTPSKYGGLADISLEMIINDDMRQMSKIGPKLGVAAKNTIEDFVEGFIVDNGNIWDASALFVGGHNNYATSAFSEEALEAAWVAMMTQTETLADSTTRTLGIKPKLILCAPLMLRTIDHVIRSAVGMSNSSPDFLQTLALTPYLLQTLTDTDAWYLVANPKEWDTIEIGFLGGKDSPELFVQNGPTEGVMFTTDVITFKVRWFWGGAVTEYRTMYGSIPA